MGSAVALWLHPRIRPCWCHFLAEKFSADCQKNFCLTLLTHFRSSESALWLWSHAHWSVWSAQRRHERGPAGPGAFRSMRLPWELPTLHSNNSTGAVISSRELFNPVPCQIRVKTRNLSRSKTHAQTWVSECLLLRIEEAGSTDVHPCVPPVQFSFLHTCYASLTCVVFV